MEVSQGGLLHVVQADFKPGKRIRYVTATEAGYPMIISEQLVVFGL